MPVIGHAFVGWATAVATRPTPHRTWIVALWTPVIITLAYLPDIAAQAASILGLGHQSVATHSLVFALAVAFALTPVFKRYASLSARFAFALTLATIAVHDALDLLQSTGRQPWWPFITEPTGLGLEIIPVNTVTEAITFAAAFAVFLLARALWKCAVTSHVPKHQRNTCQSDNAHQPNTARPSGDPHHSRAGGNPGDRTTDVDVPTSSPGRSTHRTAPISPLQVWTNRALIAAILFAACGTHYLRDRRQRDFKKMLALLGEGQYESALALADRTDRWPSTTKPGRVAYACAEAHAKLGHHNLAEPLYRQAVQADPTYFWPLADLAVFYASSDEPLAVRRAYVAPLLKHLRERFPNDPDLPRMLDKIDARLNQKPQSARDSTNDTDD